MFCSTIIPTVGRSTLARAVNSVLNQNISKDDFEIIVVNDSGTPLSEEPWQQSEQVHIINTNHRERCIARNAGAAIAKGTYLHFLDDDDWLLPGALNAFQTLASQTDVAWLYGGTQLVDRAERPLIQLHHQLEGNCFTQVIAGEWIPLQSSLIRSEAFFKVGGFHPLIPGAEDIDIARLIALSEEMRGTQILVSCIGMGEFNSTTNYQQALLDARRARERLLSTPGAFSRMLTSTYNSSYWHGRILRAYLTSAVWNLQHRRPLTTASRLLYAILAFMRSFRHLFSFPFWQAITHRHQGRAFLRGFQDIMPPPNGNGIVTITTPHT